MLGEVTVFQMCNMGIYPDGEYRHWVWWWTDGADQLNLDAMQVGFNCFLTHNLELNKANTVSFHLLLK